MTMTVEALQIIELDAATASATVRTPTSVLVKPSVFSTA